MFTVIICDNHIQKDCEKYKAYLRPLLEEESFAFCDWNAEGLTLEEAVPALPGLIQKKSEWRAILISDRETAGYEALCRRNPFDFVGEVKVPDEFASTEEWNGFMAAKRARYEQALDNPILKLTNWLFGITVGERPVLPAEFAPENLPAPDSEDFIEQLQSRDIHPTDLAMARLRLEKFELLCEHFPKDGVLFNKPVDCLVLSERVHNSGVKFTDKIETKRDEFGYSRFYEDNLYGAKLRYLLFDIDYLQGKRNEDMYFRFLTLMLLLATCEVPRAALRPYFVYNLALEGEESRVERTTALYIAKLNKTIQQIQNGILYYRKKEKEMPVLESHTSEKVFESDARVTVKMPPRFADEKFQADYKGVGLSRDCPVEEEYFWDNQYRSLKKKFIRFLREPRRAVQTAIETDFERQKAIEDERAFQLSDFQREDIQYRLEDEENNMVETHTNAVFDTEQYLARMAEADKRLKRNIGQRMTKLRTVVTALIAVGVYLVGFLPLIFTELNSAGSFLFGFLFIGGAVAALAAVGLVYLFLLRKRLIDAFKHFNFVMSGIRQEIDHSMQLFSQYLTHACNVMREFSVFNYLKKNDTVETQTVKVMQYHIHTINTQINEAVRIFGGNGDLESYTFSDREATPYDFDFTRCRPYVYEMPCVETDNRIAFIQPTNEISVPIDYVRSVTLKREDLYD